jgi:uncharacterized protein (DUF433 family)
MKDHYDFSKGKRGAVLAASRYNAAMTNAAEIGSLIDHDPKIRGGRPKVAGTGVTVMRVAGWYKLGLTPEDIVTEYGHLSLAQVHAALAYYHANCDEIEADLAEEAAPADALERERILTFTDALA